MPARLQQLLSSLAAHGLTPERIAIGACIFLVSLVGSIALVAAVLVRLPTTYFCEDEAMTTRGAHPRPKLTARTVGKNVLGVLLVAVGAVLSIPGVPGQGLLTILIGVLLLDIPGMRRLERRIVRQPQVLASINRLRHRYGREPLQI